VALLWNGDLETGDLSQLGNFEWGGGVDGTPPLSQRVTVAQNIDGYTAAQGSYFMRLIVAPGDQYGASNGWRTLFRQANPIPIRGAGYDSTFVWAMLVPPGWPGDANVWLCGLEVHHTGTTVAPSHVYMYANDMLLDVQGGNDAAFTRYVLQHFEAGYTKGVWHVFVSRIRHNLAPNGIYQLWHGQLGRDATMTPIVDAQNIGTMYSGFNNYMLFGHYRGQTGVGTTTCYIDACREYSTSAEALAYAEGILADNPDPTPIIANVGPWSTALFVNSRTAILTPTQYGSWSTGKLVRSNEPAPADAYAANWTTPVLVQTASPVPPPEGALIAPRTLRGHQGWPGWTVP
jgi:hypothetical protein